MGLVSVRLSVVAAGDGHLLTHTRYFVYAIIMSCLMAFLAPKVVSTPCFWLDPLDSLLKATGMRGVQSKGP